MAIMSLHIVGEKNLVINTYKGITDAPLKPPLKTPPTARSETQSYIYQHPKTLEKVHTNSSQ